MLRTAVPDQLRSSVFRPLVPFGLVSSVPSPFLPSAPGTLLLITLILCTISGVAVGFFICVTLSF